MKTNYILIALIILSSLFSCTKEHPPVINDPVFGEMYDVDGNNYQYTEIKGDTWLIENLSVTRFQNGDTILEAKTDDEWYEATFYGIPVWCHYDNDSLNGLKYGKMYNLAAVTDPRGLAPEGWHISTRSEWKNLLDNYGGEWEAGLHLKAENGWLDNGNGNNDSYFTAVPGGQRFSGGAFYGIGKTSLCWTGTPVENAEYSNYTALLPSINNLLNITTSSYDGGMYVRCVKD